jgi:hypothetical protein
MGVVREIAERARAASPIWAAAVRGEVDDRASFGPLVAPPLALGVETIYEAFLVHYGRSRAFAPADPEQGLLLGDYLYAAGLVEVCRAKDVGAVAALADLITRAAGGRAGGDRDDGRLWLAAAQRLGHDGRDGAAALALHAELAG